MSTKGKSQKSKRLNKEKWMLLGVTVIFILLAYLVISLTSNIKKSRVEAEKKARELADAATEVVTLAEIQDICPAEIREYVNTYSEAIEFAGNYESYSVKDVAMSLNEGEATWSQALIQWDCRWAYFKYGNTYFGINGSGPTCFAMVYANLTGDLEWSPAHVGQWAAGNGYSSNSSEGTQSTFFTNGVGSFGLDSREVVISAEGITAAFTEGRPIVALVGPGDFTQTSQYIVLCGLWGDQTVHVLDPNSPDKSITHWDINALVAQITSAWSLGIAG